jgi:hypothetical protein
MRRHLTSRLVIPKGRSRRLRRSIELVFDRGTITETLESRLKRINPSLRGRGNFYRHAWGAKRVFTALDNYVWWTIERWLHMKHPDFQMDAIASQYGWHVPRQKACAGATMVGFPYRRLPSVSSVIGRGPIPVLTMRQHQGRARCVMHGAPRVRRGASENLQRAIPEGAGCPLSRIVDEGVKSRLQDKRNQGG